MENKEFTQILYYESGPGFILEADTAGCLRSEGENRPSRPSHFVLMIETTDEGS